MPSVMQLILEFSVIHSQRILTMQPVSYTHLNFVKMLPYIYIIVAAIAGMNMMVVLTTGIILSLIHI